MPDTGAPWNIPFLDGTELVRAYPDFSEDLADAVAAGLTAAGNAGIGSNVVQTVKTDTFSSTLATYETVTGLTATITPSSALSKVLVIAQVTLGISDTNRGVSIRLAGGNTSTYIGDASGSQARVLSGMTMNSSFVLRDTLVNHTLVFLDSPDTTSQTTYEVTVAATSPATVFVNRSGQTANNVNFHRGASSITAIEVAA